MIPQKIGRYEVKSELGRGGMATVYHAFDPSFDREVAVKILPREFLHDPQFRERFKVEIKTIAALEHPAIVPVYDVGEDDDVPYFVMRYMNGGSLTNQIEKGKFSMEDAARIIERLASALAYAHKKGVVHRDLKPDNILFDANGDPFISDFGVASFANAPSNLTGNAAVGTPAYMSPEQAQGDKVDSRSDIYGLGVIIFQMLSGKQPYDADTPMGVAVKHITDPVPDILKVNPTLPRSTDTIIRTAMAKNRDDRYASATDLSRAFRDVVREGSGESSPQNAPVSSSKSGANKGLIFGGIGAGVVLLCVIIGIATFAFRGSMFGGDEELGATASPIAESTSASTEAPVANAKFFTEEFDGDVSTWEHEIITGLQSQLTISPQNSQLFFDLQGKDLNTISLYKSETYDNVRIDVSVENKGIDVSNTILICRYNEDAGWYQVNIANNGPYEIQYGKWNNQKKGASFVRLANGATSATVLGIGVNEYSMICKDRTIIFYVNGVEVKVLDENRFLMSNGLIGVGSQSFKFAPVQIGFDKVTISQP